MNLLFLSGSRGEWGYIRPIIKKCIDSGIDYSICATNMLLLPEYGSLVDEIKNDGFNVSHEIFMSLEGSNHFTMVKSLGIFMVSFIDVLQRERPDWIILAGDRGEQLVGSIAGAYTYIPVAHIQAGERSGNIDGVIRHSIGKMAHIHFAANEDAANRLIKMGEEPERVYMVGAPQLDELVSGNITEKLILQEKYFNGVDQNYLMVVMHPVTEEFSSVTKQTEILLKSLSSINMKKIWILPNNDAGSEAVRRTILYSRSSNILVYENLTRSDYLGLLKNSNAIIGNSSSGLLEAPTFGIPAVNIGRRQQDRVQGKNVINCKFNVEEIITAIKKAISEEHIQLSLSNKNPYGDGKSSERIIQILKNLSINDQLLIKNLTY